MPNVSSPVATLLAATTKAGMCAAVGAPDPAANITEPLGARTLALTDANKLIICNHVTATAITVPANVTVDWASNVPVPEIFFQRGSSAGPVTVTGAGVTVINFNTSADLPQGGYGVLRWKSSNVWDWISGSSAGAVSWASVTSKPTTLSGFGITDGITAVAAAAAYQAKDTDLDTWAAITPGTGVATALAANANASGGIVTASGTATLSNKTLTSPIYTEAAIAALDIDWATAVTFRKTLSANSTFTFSNLADGKQINVALTNTASNYTVTWPTVTWAGASTPVQTVGAKTDIYTFIRINGVVYGSVIQNF